jgi:hypothetical protein
MSDQSIVNKVYNKISQSKKGTLFFVDSFLDIGNTKSINKALERLVLSGKLHRIATGVYVRPIKDKIIGVVLPGIEEIAKAIAKRDRASIIPTGSYAMYKLGLTSQVPLNVVFYTDTSARKIKIGDQMIVFKKASSRNLAATGEISKLAIQALKTIGKDHVTNEDLTKIRLALKNEKPEHLKHDLQLAPEWIRRLLEPTNIYDIDD